MVQSRFLKTVVAFTRHNDVVQNADAENLCRFGQLLVDFQVGGAGLKVAGWVVVGKDDGGGTVGDYIGEDFARVDLAPVEQPDGHGSLFDDFICSVQGDAEKMLLLFPRNVGQ